MIYFDHNATTPLDGRVLEAMLPYLKSCHGNPSSLHRPGRIARDAVETARAQVAALAGAAPSQVVFTSGGSEANNLAIKGLAWSLQPGRLRIGATEHPSVAEPARFLCSQGWECRTLPVDAQGMIEDFALAETAQNPPDIVAVMLANNETGVIQDVARIAAVARDNGAWLHCDAVQAAGKIPLSFAQTGAHLMSLSGHKIYGPKGTGALIVDPSVPLTPLIHGGEQEKGLRGGTENVAAIVGFGKAAELAAAELEEYGRRLRRLRDILERGIETLPGTMVFARAAERLPNTVQFAIAGYDGETLVMLLDRQGLAVSSGSACASGAREPSPVLLAMGVDPALAAGAVRISLGRDNTEAEAEQLLASLGRITGVEPGP
ncbi:cysteine desulfurase family protein [Methylococcus geothermalis]|uniref:cysteine desulfurase n=1 Tax=Methylococcus geothermalis TaxID=2681310 RepID=A0A858Q5H8_9GAMM|nr:cysteine desulfurase family protein [Methylococcus geothermalis]QJD29112.1 aminotransferase class V-fold PLP-dependent enzyme [Methylococcus geothermalis]